MSPEEFKSLYGKALAGDESWADAAKAAKESSPTKAGASTGNQAVNQVKRARAQTVANPVQSQADSAPAGPQGPMPPPQQAATPQSQATPNTKLGGQSFEADDNQRSAPLYDQAGGAKGIQDRLFNAGKNATIALGQGLDEAPGKMRDMLGAGVYASATPGRLGFQVGQAIGQPIGDELAYQAQPIYDEAEAYRQKLLAMMKGGK